MSICPQGYTGMMDGLSGNCNFLTQGITATSVKLTELLSVVSGGDITCW
ncbi:hypothetical protein LC653_31000 [Nostoc sp. CHAB 5784]|nr:hypothetical protein [Nostoc mirabile]MCC5668171.1 hypothetical protein [Nostoc mirabile CHAB5784]